MTFEAHATTIVAVKKGAQVAVAGDGQVSLGNTVLKGHARKVRRIPESDVVAGFAGSTADAFTLFEKFEAKLKKHGNNLMRAAVELAKDWRTDRVLRRLEALLIVADKEHLFTISGNGDVIEPDDGITAIGSGGMFAMAAARALARKTELSAAEIATEAMNIAADICIYTNHNIVLETIE